MANKITLIRIISLPLLIFFLYREGKLMAFFALFTFVLLAVTDLLDGYVARNLGQVTSMGKFLDPIADKLLVLTALLPLISRNVIPAWMGIIILGREFIVNGIRMIAAAESKIISAGKWGKYKTTFYIVSISVIIGSPIIPFLSGALRLLGIMGLMIGILLAVISAVEYFLSYSPLESSESPPDHSK